MTLNSKHPLIEKSLVPYQDMTNQIIELKRQSNFLIYNNYDCMYSRKLLEKIVAIFLLIIRGKSTQAFRTVSDN